MGAIARISACAFGVFFFGFGAPARVPARPTAASGAAIRARAPRMRTMRASGPSETTHPAEPTVRRLSEESGMTGAPVTALAQDSAGFLWVGGVGGLFRYDGQEFRRWAPDSLRTRVDAITVSPTGEIVVVTAEPAVFRVTDQEVTRLAPPAGGWRREGMSAAFDRDGRLWVVDGRVHEYASARGWKTLAPSAFAGETPGLVRGGDPDGGMLVGTDGGAWRVGRDGGTEKLWSGRKLVDLAPGTPRGLLLMQVSGRVVALRDGHARQILPGDATPYSRAIAVTERFGTVWVSLDRYLVAVPPEGPWEVFGPSDRIESGGPLLVDREGSLWMGTFESLVQYPEPRTRRWADAQGLPSAHVRFLAWSGSDIAVVTWQGLGFLQPRGGVWRGSSAGMLAQHRPCPLADGSLLLTGGGALIRTRGARIAGRLQGPPTALESCAPSSDGGRWLATSRGLLHLRQVSGARDGAEAGLHLDEAPIPGPWSDTGDTEVTHVTLDRAGWLWVSAGDTICRTPERPLLAGGSVSWTCQPFPEGARPLTRLVALPDGEVWASSNRDGVFRFVEGHWEAVPGAADLPTRSVLDLVPSRSGGVWVLGHGFIWRVQDRPNLPSGWQVVEELNEWDGLTGEGAGSLLEDPDGSVWLATAGGVVHVPAEVRRTRPRPPPVVLVEARADGRLAPLGRTIRLPDGNNRLELRFAALSFRDPTDLRYEVRLGPRSAWSALRGTPVFRWLGLRPGTYRAQVRASLDGEHWSAPTAGLRFRVNPPLLLEPWALGVETVLLLALLFATYQARVAYLVGLERQRTHIAMDLHDEVGSGLASVGILSGVLAADGLSREEARAAASEIARTAEEMGDSLSDIVWSLQPRRVGLEELVARLVEQGGRLFADGDTRFRAELPPDYPDEALSLPVLRTVLLVGLEALHNAAKHAGARCVTLRLRPSGDAWVLEVRDDGVGLPAGAAVRPSVGTGPSARRGARRTGSGGRRGGHGLPGMARRAEEVGATLELASAPGDGTTVRLRFGLQTRSWLTRVRRSRLARWIQRSRSRPLA